MRYKTLNAITTIVHIIFYMIPATFEIQVAQKYLHGSYMRTKTKIDSWKHTHNTVTKNK